MSGDLITVLPSGSVEVKARRRVSEPGAWETFMEQLQSTLVSVKDTNPNAVVSDLDVSQNKATPDQFEQLFNVLALVSIKVQRFRLFGCPGFNDDAMHFLTEYLSNDLTNETSPAELHLSDCALTSDGFLFLMNAIEEKELYPTTSMKGRSLPLYLRLENNYIEEALMQEKIDAGIIRRFKKPMSMEAPPSVKVNLIVQKESGSLQQKEGPPPAPEDAPPPKEVHDRPSNWSKGWSAHSKGGWPAHSKGQQWNSRQAGWSASPGHGWGGRMAQPALGAPVQRGMMRPGTAGMQRPGTWNNARPVGEVGQTWPRGTSGTANDRSRTPNGKVVPPPTKQAVKSKLPHPWEEQWSEEYNIPYYWNADTGESLWEKAEVLKRA